MSILTKLMQVQMEGKNLDLDKFNEYPGPFESEEDILNAIHQTAMHYGVVDVNVVFREGPFNTRMMIINIENKMYAKYNLVKTI